jgi:hypothetical protein
MQKKKNSTAVKNHKEAMTLTEVLVAAVIMALAITGIANIFVVGKRYVTHTRSKVAAGEISKIFLEPLQLDVRDDTWWGGSGVNDLAIGTRYCDSVGGHTQMLGCPPQDRRRLNDVLYDATYDISGFGELRRVQLTINWSENP